MAALEKAKGALDQARSLLEEHGAEMPAELDRQYVELLAIARTQATVAQAEALHRQADAQQRQADALIELVAIVGERVS